ncbi:MAG: nicotinamide riboside transporter PnuC [Paludibacter sp.]|nr:nicotinamide riboside transporter PnuC [Bacteroidales bacterium]MCM1068984.1 nicotinamide riboside transporter PnuC [Prevotella sp.]MCM1353647.1 nicotinamide riboside transporter PnuC [Bacteroides sp.]MCM1442004.1 nicotinamide riboside transporter PnuC [Muribaculum sp.]MCM1481540.1 nicotinamide riboside transporter PnuC [Paludibacter sp.]
MAISKERCIYLLKAEFVNGRTAFDWCFLAVGILVQIVAYVWNPQSLLAFVSALAGICSVILCSQRKISTFLFGFLQVSTYLWLAWRERLYAESVQNVFYFITMLYGVYAWKRNYAISKDDSSSLVAKRLSVRLWVLSTLLIAALSIFCGWLLATYTDDTQPYLDAFTTVPAIFAQILMITGYREQWFFWLLIDMALTVLWIRAGNWCMVMQHVFWCVNCVYGYIVWSKPTTEQS